jgi:uncharacterized protein
MKAVVVAFSGGVDSTLLAVLAHEALGNQALCITLAFPAFPRMEVFEAIKLAQQCTLNHRVIESQTLLPCIEYNAPDRCYRCKKEMCRILREEADREDIPYILEGSTSDDRSLHRPGRQAVLEAGLLSPLQHAGITKSEIRTALDSRGIPNAGKPPGTCLATRFAYGTHITPEALQQVENAEAALRKLGFRQTRLRVHGPLARLETDPDDISRLSDHVLRQTVVRILREAGFHFITLDLEGYRTGSMDEPDTAGSR